MDLKTVIFIGRSGCGKGTQAKLFIEALKQKDAEHAVVYVETGQAFRDFLTRATYSSQLSQKIYVSGQLQPEFLAVYMWADFFVKNVKGDEHMVIDGTPRKLRETLVLDTAFEFYKRATPTIVHINVSPDWSRERLKERKRSDDVNEEEVEKRLAWFETDVVPAIEWYKITPGYRYVEINGERPIEDVQKDIVLTVLN